MADNQTDTNWSFTSAWNYLSDKATELTNYGKNIGKDTTEDAFLNQTKYDFSYRTFPVDIASAGSHHQHYMVININVRDSNGYNTESAYNNKITGPNGDIKTFTVDYNEMSKTDILRFNLDKLYKGNAGQPLGISGNSGFLPVMPRFTRRVVESIAIFMPQSVNFSNQHDYESISMMTMGTELAGSVAAGTSAFNAGLHGRPGLGSNIIGSAIGGLQEKAGNLAQMAQMPLNPMTEVLFRTTPQRQFVFDFLMAPSNRAESVAMDQIYKVLRFHAAPELTQYVAPLFRAPSEFDLTFFHQGKENLAIPRINTCVLEKIDMDYSPTGVYATFSNGAPVMARMTLFFRELESVTKIRVVEGF